MTSRWRTYQSERFPLVAMGTLASVLAGSALAFSALARDAVALPATWNAIAAAASALLLFAQMRVLDEFKDADEDRAFRPYRPVQRGLVTLGELGWIGAVAAVVQLALALSVDARLAWLLAGVWAYLGLMASEFFVPGWLKARPLAYLVSHLPVSGGIAFYLTAFDWLPAGMGAHPALAWWAACAVGAAALLEIGRKIRAPGDEERGVVTYSAAWGRDVAIAAWYAAGAATLLAGWLAARTVGLAGPFAALAAMLGLLAVTCGMRYLARPVRARARQIDTLSGIATLALYAGLGPLGLIVAS
jgi:4-hydroxybenzoate polyprenyltransferase